MMTPLHTSPYAEVFTATPAGHQLLEASPELQEVANRFLESNDPEDAFREHGTHLGMGSNSELRVVGGAVVKISTLTTGRQAHRTHSEIEPEDLIGQFDFMRALGAELEQMPQADVVVPEQFFAIKSNRDDYLLVQQNMVGWQPIGSWSSDRGYGPRRSPNGIYEPVKQRLRDTLGSSALKHGVNDLGIWSKRPLHGGNLLVPKDADNLDGPLCIIDQPASGWRAKFAVRAARKQLKKSDQLSA